MITRRNSEIAAVILGSVLAGALYTWYAGEDINWDWRNYHEYGAFALLNGRFDIDVAPGGLQTFLNPLAYLPAYLLRHHVGAPFWGMILGAIDGLGLALIWWISRLVLGQSASAWTIAAAVVIAAFGPMTLSEVGTSFADILTALPVIAGLGFMLSAGATDRLRHGVAGILIGAAVGLKLTNMAFFIGAGVSLLFAVRPLLAMGWFALGGILGALGTGGAWGWMLWQEFGSPVFPFYNNVFRSPEAPLASIVDMRFMPHTLWEAAAYPFDWMVGDTSASSEVPFRDPRFATVFLLWAANAVASLTRKMRLFRRRDKQLLLFFAIAYGLWLFTISIHRYSVVLELLAAPLIVLLLARLLRALQRRAPGLPPPRLSRRSNVAIVGLALAIALDSQAADWSRRPWSDPYRPELPPPLGKAAIYLLIEKPLGYLVPQLGAGSRTYQLADILLPIAPGGLLDHRIRSGLADPLPGGVWALHLRGSPPRQCLLDHYGLQFDGSRACAIIRGADNAEIEACPLRPSPQAAALSGSC